jgi:hypothetical protein
VITSAPGAGRHAAGRGKVGALDGQGAAAGR